MDGRIREEAAPLAGWDSPLVRACAEGLMGGVWPGGGEPPTAAAAVIGDFIFLAGRPDAALLARACAHAAQRERLLVPREAAWHAEILRRWQPYFEQLPEYEYLREELTSEWP